MKNLLIFAVLFVISVNVLADPVMFLEEKTAFCYSESSLAKYLSMARIRNLDGMNELVLAGECDFVPDGKMLPLKNVRKKLMGPMPVVAFSQVNETLWTFQAFVQEVELNSQL